MSFDLTNPDKPTTKHDPDAVLDYCWDFSGLIDEDDVIESVVFKTVPGITATPGRIDGAKVWGWVSVQDTALTRTTVGVTCEYTTHEGRIDDRTLFFKLVER